MRRVALLAALTVAACLALDAVAADPHTRTIIRGRQVAYDGKGPEWWAREYRREHTRRVALERQLAGQRRSLAVHQPSYGTSALERDFLCIHAGEGAWTDPDAPYYGGLQMDMEFQRTYGPEFLRAFGTADHWPVSVQIAVAIKAYLSGRGFYPWPQTARACGLIG